MSRQHLLTEILWTNAGAVWVAGLLVMLASVPMLRRLYALDSFTCLHPCTVLRRQVSNHSG